MLVDSHCHLDFPDFAEDFDDVLARARAAEVATLVTICTKLSRAASVLDLAERADNVYCTVGVHPHEAAEEGVAAPDPLLKLARHDKVVGIGETGLDYHYEHSPREAQQESFRAHIAASRESGLPLIVHSREADADTVAMLRDAHRAGPFPGLIHCFTATHQVAEAVLEMGFYISISGIVTFKNAVALREIAREIPEDRLLVETDAPYLAPAPHRGKRNEPAFVVHTASALAELRGVSPAALAAATSDNFFRLFSKTRRPA